MSKNDRYPSRVSGAARSGGFFAASVSEWNEVSAIHSTGSTNSMPTTQARTRQRHPPPRRLPTGHDRHLAAHRPTSSLNSVDTERSANVAMMIVPITTITPAAEARP